MARLHKISMFVLDVNEDYDDIQKLVEYAFDRTEASAHFVETQTVEFPWYDEIVLNMNTATKQDYEDFMDESGRRYKMIENAINLEYDVLLESVKKILESSKIEPTDKNIIEFMKQMKHEAEWRLDE